MNLYEIDNAIMSLVDEETGEIMDPEAFEDLDMQREDKIENIACWIKNLKSDAEQLKNEEKALCERRKSAERKAESLKGYLQRYLAGEKFKTAKVSVSYRKSDSVEVTNIKEIPEEYLKYSDPEPMKMDIKAAIKSGVKIPGAILVTDQNMIIK